MNSQVACEKCMQLEKHEIKRINIYYNENEYCVQCTRERTEKKRKQKILDENLLITLSKIKKEFGGKDDRRSRKNTRGNSTSTRGTNV